MLFHHIARNAHAARDFILGQIIEAAQHEALAAARRQFLDGAGEDGEPLAPDQSCFRIGRGVGGIGVVEGVDRLPDLAPLMVEDEIGQDAIEKGAGAGDAAAIDAREAQAGLLNEIVGGMRATQPATREAQKLAIAGFDDAGTQG